MRLDETARAILVVTALAWSIPFGQAGESRQKREAPPAASPVEGVQDANDGLALRD